MAGTGAAEEMPAVKRPGKAIQRQYRKVGRSQTGGGRIYRCRYRCPSAGDRRRDGSRVIAGTPK
jgi:hypothetical protein